MLDVIDASHSAPSSAPGPLPSPRGAAGAASAPRAGAPRCAGPRRSPSKERGRKEEEGGREGEEREERGGEGGILETALSLSLPGLGVPARARAHLQFEAGLELSVRFRPSELCCTSLWPGMNIPSKTADCNM